MPHKTGRTFPHLLGEFGLISLQPMEPVKPQFGSEAPYWWPENIHCYRPMDSPLIRFFVASCDNVMSWSFSSQKWDTRTLNQYVREELLPGLKPTDPEMPGEPSCFARRYYIRDLNAELIEEDRHCSHLAMLHLGLEPTRDEDKATSILFYNTHKFQRFQEWWLLMNSQYGGQPALCYCLLKGIFAASRNETHRPVARAECAAIHVIAAGIIDGSITPDINLSARYVKVRMAPLVNRNGWTYISDDWTLDAAPDEKISLLSHLGRLGGWCFGSESVARSVLGDGDVVVLCREGLPVGALQLGQNRWHFSDLRNSFRQMSKYVRDIQVLGMTLFGEEEWWRDHYSRRDLKKMIPPESWSESDWYQLLLRNPFAWNYAPEGIRADLHFKKRILDELFLQTRRVLLPHFEIPNEFCNLPQFTEYRIGMWKYRIWKNWLRSHRIPAELVSDSGIREARKIALLYNSCLLQTTPSREDLSLFSSPEAPRRWYRSWVRWISRSAYPAEIIPGELRCFSEINEAWLQGWLLKAHKQKEVPSVLLENATFLKVWRQLWISELSRRGFSKGVAPLLFSDDEEIQESWHAGWISSLSGWGVPEQAIPGEFRDDTETYAAWRAGWMSRLGSWGYPEEAIPEQIRDDEEIRTAWQQGWNKLESTKSLSVIMRETR